MPGPITPPQPVWLLDVDEVVNANRAGWGRAPSTGTVYIDGRAGASNGNPNW